MNILIICPYYLPTQTPRAFRWSSVISKFLEEGHQVHLITSQNKSAQASSNENLYIHRVGYLNVKEWLNSKSNSSSGHVERSSKEPFIFKIAHSIWKNIYWPDGAFIWIKPAKSKIKKLQKNINFDVMISVSLPFSSHCVAKDIKLKNPELKWIVDIGDPFSIQIENPKNNLLFYKRRNIKNERKILHLANKLSITSEELLTIYKNKFNINGHKVAVIPPLLREGFPMNIPKKENNNQVIRFIYFGSFYSKIREPKKLLEVFSLLKNANLNFTLDLYGNYEHEFITAFTKFPALSDSINIHQSLAPKDLIEKISEANILVNLGNKYNYQIPSKLPEYIASAKPILNIVYNEADSFKNALKKHPLIHNFNYDDSFEISNLLAFITAHKNNFLSENEKDELLKKYLLDAVYKQYKNLIK